MMKISKVAHGWVGLIGLATVGYSQGAFAAKNITAAGKAPIVRPELSEQEYDKEVKAAEERGSRTVASADAITEQALSDSFNNLRSQVIGGPVFKDGKATDIVNKAISTPEQLQTFLAKLQDDQFYNGLDNDAKFVAAQMAPLIVFNGFFNRVMNLIPKAPMAHMAVVTALRSFGSGTVTYFPTDQWKAGLLYVTKPMASTGAPIDRESELHTFIEKELSPAVEKMTERLEKLNFKDKPIYIDNKIFYGSANFSSDRDRFVRAGEPERRAALAGSYLALSGLYSLNAYNLNGLFEAMDQVGAAYGFSSFSAQFTGSIDPAVATAKKRFDILKKINQSTQLFDRRPGGEAWMKSSYSCLSLAVSYSSLAWSELKRRSNDAGSDGNILDPRALMPFSRVIGTGLNNMRYIVKGEGKTNIQSAVVSTDGRRVSLKNFYYNSPSSLVKLFPTQFDQTPYKNMVEINGTKREWHNFLNGRPTAWSLEEYKKIFPEVTSNDDVSDAARVTAQAWGGWMLGIPLSAFIL